jgi:histidyl-tRNA synthetase
MTALKNLGKLSGEAASGPILVTIMDRDRIGDYAKMAQELRTELNPVDENNQPLGPTIPVELFQGNPKDFPKQLRYADRRGSPIAIIQGGNEKGCRQAHRQGSDRGQAHRRNHHRQRRMARGQGRRASGR